MTTKRVHPKEATKGADHMSPSDGRADQTRHGSDESRQREEQRHAAMTAPDRAATAPTHNGGVFGNNTVGEPLSPEAQKLIPFVKAVIETAPQDVGRSAPQPGAARRPQFIGKPVGNGA